VGLYFVWLNAQGRLPAEFAFRAGWGDVATATGALLLLPWPQGPWFRRALLTWNVFGAADLLVAVGTAGWLNIVRPDSMAEMASLPLTLVPLWIVPVLFASHVYLVRQQLCSKAKAGVDGITRNASTAAKLKPAGSPLAP
jgi:hypothetical protein